MASFYHSGSRALQDRFDTRRLADRVEEQLVKDHVSSEDADFIQRLPMFFLATADEHGQPQCSYKGGAPGFVRVVDPRTLAFPSYDGNGMYLSLGNVAKNPRVGLLFIDFEGQQRLRLSGIATMQDSDPLLEEYPGAQLIVRVAVSQVFPNCPRYVHKMQLVESSSFVPKAGCEAPVPDWKRRSWSHDVLPAGDPAKKAEPLE